MVPSFFRRLCELEIMNIVSDFDEIDLEHPQSLLNLFHQGICFPWPLPRRAEERKYDSLPKTTFLGLWCFCFSHHLFPPFGSFLSEFCHVKKFYGCLMHHYYMCYIFLRTFIFPHIRAFLSEYRTKALRLNEPLETKYKWWFQSIPA